MVPNSCWAFMDVLSWVVALAQVTISRSQAGKQAVARAVLRETGHLVGVRLNECGSK